MLATTATSNHSVSIFDSPNRDPTLVRDVGAQSTELAHEGGRHHVARRETPATSRRFDIAELLEEARRVEGRADFQRSVAGVSGLDL